MSPDLNPIEHMWGILTWKVEKHHVSNIQQLCDVIMEEWKRMPATTSVALVNFMPRRIKAVQDKNGAPTKCDPLCEIQAKVSKSNFEITSIKVGFQTLISL